MGGVWGKTLLTVTTFTIRPRHTTYLECIAEILAVVIYTTVRQPHKLLCLRLTVSKNVVINNIDSGEIDSCLLISV